MAKDVERLSPVVFEIAQRVEESVTNVRADLVASDPELSTLANVILTEADSRRDLVHGALSTMTPGEFFDFAESSLDLSPKDLVTEVDLAGILQVQLAEMDPEESYAFLRGAMGKKDFESLMGEATSRWLDDQTDKTTHANDVHRKTHERGFFSQTDVPIGDTFSVMLASLGRQEGDEENSNTKAAINGTIAEDGKFEGLQSGYSSIRNRTLEHILITAKRVQYGGNLYQARVIDIAHHSGSAGRKTRARRKDIQRTANTIMDTLVDGSVIAFYTTALGKAVDEIYPASPVDIYKLTTAEDGAFYAFPEGSQMQVAGVFVDGVNVFSEPPKPETTEDKPNKKPKKNKK